MSPQVLPQKREQNLSCIITTVKFLLAVTSSHFGRTQLFRMKMNFSRTLSRHVLPRESLVSSTVFLENLAKLNGQNTFGGIAGLVTNTRLLTHVYCYLMSAPTRNNIVPGVEVVVSETRTGVPCQEKRRSRVPPTVIKKWRYNTDSWCLVSMHVW